MQTGIKDGLSKMQLIRFTGNIYEIFYTSTLARSPLLITNTYFKGAVFTLLLKYNKVLFLLGK